MYSLKLAAESKLESLSSEFPIAKIDPDELLERCCAEEIAPEDKLACEK